MKNMKNIKKILVVDDSAFMRRVISDIINSDSRCEVIATAVNGKDGLKKIKELKPDAITLDIQMPIMDGLTMLKKLNESMPTPVIMMSTLTQKGAKETINALELGAFDFVTKPDNIFKVNSEAIKDELIEKILLSISSRKSIGKAAGSVPVMPVPKSTVRVNERKQVYKKRGNKLSKLVAIGTSTGGPRALQSVLPYIPGDVEAGFVIVQHMPPGFTKSLSERLNQLSQISVKEAEDGDIIENGWAYIAPGDYHLVVCDKSDGTLYIKLEGGPQVGGHKPAVNVMMKSIATIKQKKFIGVIMTGMGADGTEGLVELHEKRDIHIIAQDSESCVVYGMPKALVNSGITDEIVSLNKIADSIVRELEVL